MMMVCMFIQNCLITHTWLVDDEFVDAVSEPLRQSDTVITIPSPGVPRIQVGVTVSLHLCNCNSFDAYR